MLTKISLFQLAFGNMADITEVSWKKAMFNCVNRHFQILVNEIEKSLEKCNLRSAMYLLGEVQQPLKKGLYLNCHFEAKNCNEILTIEEMYQLVDKCSLSANAQQEMILAHEILDDIDDTLKIDDKLDRNLIALNHIVQAKQSSKDDLKLFCKAKLYEGKIYSFLLPNTEKAKNCFKEVIDIALSQSYTNTVWYHEALDLFQQIKREEEKKNSHPQKNKEVYLRELEKEITMLKKTEEMSNEKFVPFLSKNFPPKHKVGVKEPPVSQTQ